MRADRNIKILIVDDSPPIRHLVKKSLQDLHFNNFEEASDGNEAFEKLSQDPGYKLVLLDWQMPNMTGIELLRKIRAEAKLRHVPVVMITAEALKDNILEAAQAGISGYIIKPFDAFTLGEKIEKILGEAL
ncbi:MAG: hypothetical protein A2527_13260 [Candidatus Lambdaproteobacteria bacterium RIFOXYD2_FULL_50_16]|uniref:Response regulatory domain-containing protein n=1 Tax=Candidatus Lambdaproteobacteria bacterium RIFOXYD2_FULL_50_16 TaxID=1817772 RepID=A0A1F6GG75_9PROT|nr:MAG: hypothetical protein A2527_13260 [Candidatus Lambdaproteobacteria bacterium RIFOXYD2_FULL_50_16]